MNGKPKVMKAMTKLKFVQDLIDSEPCGALAIQKQLEGYEVTALQSDFIVATRVTSTDEDSSVLEKRTFRLATKKLKEAA